MGSVCVCVGGGEEWIKKIYKCVDREACLTWFQTQAKKDLS